MSEATLLVTQKVAADYYGVAEGDIKSHSKTRIKVHARQLCWYLAREITEYSYVALGAFFDRDHSTIQYGCVQVARRLDDSAVLRADIGELKRRVRAGVRLTDIRPIGPFKTIDECKAYLQGAGAL